MPEVKVTLSWDDAEDRDAKRERDNFKVSLMRDGVRAFT